MAKTSLSVSGQKANKLGWWVRFYASDLTDMARQKLSDANYRTLDDLERLAGLSNGALPGVDEIAFQLRLESMEAEQRVAALAEAGFLVRDGEALRLPDSSLRQFRSDISTSRVREHRKRKNETHGKDGETFHETAETPNELFHETGETPNETDRSDQIRTEQNRTEQNRTEQNRSSSSEGAVSRWDDDELLRKLREAAPGRIDARCVDTRPIRMLMDEGIKLDAILTVISDRVPKLKAPLETFSATWLVDAIRAYAKARSRDGPSCESVPETTFVRVNDRRWPALEKRFRRERGIMPATKTDSHGDPGWYFPADWPEVAASSLFQN